jgi:PIN domain nuclease of toxin-antitoxin system
MILLDTHVAVWMLVEDGNLSKKVRVAIREERAQQRKIGCSLVSLYEIANAVRRKRITLSVPVGQFLGEVQKRLTILPITPEIVISAAQFPPMHGDPMDRIIAATAMIENCTLITADRKILESGVCKTLW